MDVTIGQDNMGKLSPIANNLTSPVLRIEMISSEQS